MKHKRRVATGLACLGMLTASLVAPPTASAQSSVRSEAVRGARGFGGGNIHYPSSSSGALPIVAVAPGFASPESSIRWIGPELAEEGMVVITIATNSTSDQPASRGRQLQAALDHVIANPPSGVQVDRTRLGVAGWSMGGGGALSAASSNPEIDVAMPLAGWHGTKNWSRLRTPTLVVAAGSDAIAPARSHSIPFYESLGGEKVYIEFRGASHNLPTRPNTTLANYMDAFTKLFLKGDASGASVVCSNNSAFSGYENTCPLTGAPSNPGGPNPTTPPPTTPPPSGGGCSWWQWWCR